MAKKAVVPFEKIDRAILLIRNKRVMLDADLALVFGTTTKRLNERVKRNLDRFPKDFFFQLTPGEKEEVVANCDHLRQLRFSPVNPYTFTEHGTIMLAAILNKQVERALTRLILLIMKKGTEPLNLQHVESQKLPFPDQIFSYHLCYAICHDRLFPRRCSE